MKHWKNFDWQLLVIPVIVVIFSSVMLYEIARWAVGVPSGTPYRQISYLVMGLVLFWVLTNIDYKLLARMAWPLYGLTLAMLVFVSVVGHSAYGATRWINLGFIQLQPSEPAKLVTVLLLAKFLSDRENKMSDVSTLIGSLIIVVVPALLVLRQPDFGTAMVLGAIWLASVVTASIPPVYLAGVAACAAAATPLAWLKVLKPFQRTRLTSFLHPNQDVNGTNFSLYHARIAVGSGGPFGEWFGKRTQTRLNFLSVPDKDFIFSVIAENIGFLGILVLFAFYAALFLRMARVAFIAADRLGRLIATGVLAMLLFQTFVNIGMNIGIMPVTGVPLPFVSYGGSSLLTSLAALGILESILLRHKKLIFDTGHSIL